jgi:hypothetical protein
MQVAALRESRLTEAEDLQTIDRELVAYAEEVPQALLSVSCPCERLAACPLVTRREVLWELLWPVFTTRAMGAVVTNMSMILPDSSVDGAPGRATEGEVGGRGG